MTPMTQTTTSASLLDRLDQATFDARFNRRPFVIGHHLADHPLFTLPRLIELAQKLPQRKVEYNSGELPVAQNVWQITLARLLWELLAPSLLLAVPLTGEVIHCVITDAKATVDLDFALRARGVPSNARLWRHHLRQLLPLPGS